ncbi:hypothetical protein FB451DRAFT_49220 [Mycena latifolia]|nr:hypothetical protein FB451DRAFT_49220 [Mycena latifolia]
MTSCDCDTLSFSPTILLNSFQPSPHAALRLENIPTLSPSLQRAANLLMYSESDIQAQHFEGPQPVIGLFRALTSEIVPLLPIFYGNLDPARIPSAEMVEDMQIAGKHSNAVLAAMQSLQSISAMPKFPRGVYPELWPRAWGWIAFLHTYSEHLLGLPRKKVLYGTFVELCVSFRAAGFCKLIASTPGVREVMTTAWDLFLDVADSDAIELRNVSFFINWDLMTPISHDNVVDEYLAGAGGSLESLASMVIKHLNHAAANGLMS